MIEFALEPPSFQLDGDKFAAEIIQVKEDVAGVVTPNNPVSLLQPDASFIFCRLPDCAAASPEVAGKLFVDHNIYTKHCQGKTMLESDRYLRIASRTETENCTLVDALKILLTLKECNTFHE